MAKNSKTVTIAIGIARPNHRSPQRRLHKGFWSFMPQYDTGTMTSVKNIKETAPEVPTDQHLNKTSQTLECSLALDFIGA